MQKKRHVLKCNLAFLVIVSSIMFIINGKTHAIQKTTQQICETFKNISIPSQTLTNESLKSLKHCDALSLYYGFESSVDYTKARECALLHKNYEVLTMIYANGKAVNPNLDIALHYACILNASPAEMDARINHLNEIKKMKTLAGDFTICDDITSGYMMGFCASLTQRAEKAQQQKNLQTLKAKWTTKEREIFARLQKSSKIYFKNRIENEIDNQGSGRAAFMIYENIDLNARMMNMLNLTEQCKLPILTVRQYQEVDMELNALYNKIQKGQFSKFSKNGIKQTELTWLQYRDAWANFGHLKCPHISIANWKALVTQDRIRQLKKLVD